jgi:hypothetical protein
LERYGNKLIIQAYIFSWPKVHHRISKIVQDIKQCKISQITIVSSGEHPYVYEDVNIVNIGDDAHYGEQFATAANIFQGDVFLQVQGDVTIGNPINLDKHLKTIFENPEIGVWTPHVNFTSWVDAIVHLEYDYQYHVKSLGQQYKKSKVVLNTDCTFWAIRSNLIKEYLKTPLVKSKFGWGIDLTISSMTYARQMLAIRDRALKINHPRNTGYNQNFASNEWLEMYGLLDSQIKPMIWMVSTLLKSRSFRYNRKFKTRFINLVYFLIKKIKSFKKMSDC